MCRHHRVCGDQLIAVRVPDYFQRHPHTPLGMELQLCVRCGDAKLVRIGASLPASSSQAKPQIRNGGTRRKPVTVQTKQCTACLQVLSATEFWGQSSTKDGLQYRCKECARRRRREVPSWDGDRRAKQREYNRRHPEVVQKARAAYKQRIAESKEE